MREIRSPLSGFASPFGARRVSGPQILLSASSVLESALSGSTVGVLSVVNGSGTYTFTKTADPDSKFAVSGSNLNTAAALDYETATSHSVTISADNGVDDPIVRTFTISVTNVFEAGTLGDLGGTFTLAEDATQGASAGTITGKTTGSTLTLIDNAGGRVQLNADGVTIEAGPTALDFEASTSHNFTVRETLADSSNSPKDNVLSLTVTDVSEGAEATVLTRESDGTVTVESLAPTWTPILTRESDGTVTVTEA